MSMVNVPKITFISIVSLAIVLLSFSSVQAATVYVDSTSGNDTTGDGSSGTPYKTFHKGYTQAGIGDTIDLTGTFTWTDADETGDVSTSGYTIGKNITIEGQGATSTIVQAASSENAADRRVFTVSVGVTTTIEGITIRYGVSGSSDGAGIHVDGEATIDACTVSYNRATTGSGGGINVRGKATVQNSTVHDNVAYYKGGGINRNYYSGSGGTPGAGDTLDIINTTIAFNEVTQTVAYLEGGGVFFRRGGGTITNSTIAYNEVTNGGSSKSTHGIGTGDSGSTVYLKNNIIAKNYLSSNGGDLGHRSGSNGSFVDNGNNIIGRFGYYIDMTATGTTWVDASAYNVSIDAEYDMGASTGTLHLDTTLADNSTTLSTQTLAVTSTASIAVNNGGSGTNEDISIPSSDQRGISRGITAGIGAFELEEDVTAPSVSSFSPADNAINIAVGATFTITFDENVVTSTGNAILYKTSDNSTVETIDITSGLVTTSGTTAFVIDPATTLDGETEYYWMLDATAVDDSSGNSYAGITASTTWSFTTIDTTNPIVSVLSPADNATAVAIGDNLVITFDEIVDAESGNIVLYKASDDSIIETFDVAADISGSGSTEITINPAADLSYETEYYVIVAATAFDDIYSNSYAGITASTTWSFTTADTPTCSTVDNAASYNAYPTCGVATCESGYTLDSGSCVASGGGMIIIAPTVGLGTFDSFISLGETSHIGTISTQGTNIATYIHSPAIFEASVSNGGNPMSETHELEIIAFDLMFNVLTIELRSDPKNLTLSLGTSAQIDIDNDGVDDLEIMFEDIVTNRAELTVTSIVTESIQTDLTENTESIIDELPKDPFVTPHLYTYTRDLKLEMNGADVRELQKFLNMSGYRVSLSGYGSPGNETTYFGRATQAALAKYQAANNLPAFGYFGSLTRSMMQHGDVEVIKVFKLQEEKEVVQTKAIAFIFDRNLEYGMKGPDVLALQQYLNTNGYSIAGVGEPGSAGNETEYFGIGTKDALIRYQNAYRLPAYGYFGPLTRESVQ